MGQDMLSFIIASPNTHATACEDIVLTGLNYQTADFRTEKPGDMVVTGAYVPFGTGVHVINMARIADDRLPFEWPPETGSVWKVTRE